MARLQVAGHRRIHFAHHAGGGASVVLPHGQGMGRRVWDNNTRRCGASNKYEDAERHRSALLDFLGGIGS